MTMTEPEKSREWTVGGTSVHGAPVVMSGPNLDPSEPDVRVIEAVPVERLLAVVRNERDLYEEQRTEAKRKIEELRRINEFDIGVANHELKERVAELERLLTLAKEEVERLVEGAEGTHELLAHFRDDRKSLREALKEISETFSLNLPKGHGAEHLRGLARKALAANAENIPAQEGESQ